MIHPNMVGVKLLTPGAKLPKKATEESSGFDLYATEPFILEPGDYALVPTGVAVSMPEWMEAQVRSRSGLAAKFGVFVLNSPGTIDSDYTGEIKVILMNAGREEFTISPGDRVAQLVFMALPPVGLEIALDLKDTERGEGGFGSTGTK